MDSKIEIQKFDFSPIEIFQTSWSKLDGAKGPIILTVVINMVLVIIGSSILMMFGLPQILISIAQFAIGALFYAAVVRMGIRWYQGSTIEISDAFYYFKNTELLVPIFLTQVIVGTLVSIGMMLFILPGLYLAITYMLAMPLVLDRKLPFWEAMETSRKMLTTNFISALLFMILIAVFMILASIPFLIGLVWVLPMIAIATAILYDKAFGLQTQF